MQAHYHLAVSTLVSGGFYAVTDSWPGALACWLSGFLIDLDHFPDYFINFRRQQPRPGFFQVFDRSPFKILLLPLHAWELVPAFAAWALMGPHPLVAWGLALGFFHHLLADQFLNRHSPWAYFFSYRAWHRFDSKKYYGPGEYQRRKSSPDVILP